MRFWVATALVCLVYGEQATAHMLHVPSDYVSIQAAINATISGDTVLVADGTYYEHLNYHGKAIVVSSRLLVDNNSSHIASTIIDGSRPGLGDTGSVVIFCNGENAAAQLRGLTLHGGNGTPVSTPEWGDFYAGNDLLVTHGSPLITDCAFSDIFVLPQHGPAQPSLEQCHIDDINCMDNGWIKVRKSHVGSVDARYGAAVAISASSVSDIAVEEGSAGVIQTSTIARELFCSYSTYAVDSCTVSALNFYGDGGLAITHTLVLSTIAAQGNNGSIGVSNCTILGKTDVLLNCLGVGNIENSILIGGVYHAARLTMHNSIVGSAAGLPVANCAQTLDTAAVFVLDPQFCSVTDSVYTVSDGSLAAPTNNPSGQLIGAYEVGCSCCVGSRGNLDGRAETDLYDLSLLVSYLCATIAPTLPCASAANVNGQGTIDLSDLALLVDYLTGHLSTSALPACSGSSAGT